MQKDLQSMVRLNQYLALRLHGYSADNLWAPGRRDTREPDFASSNFNPFSSLFVVKTWHYFTFCLLCFPQTKVSQIDCTFYLFTNQKLKNGRQSFTDVEAASPCPPEGWCICHHDLLVCYMHHDLLICYMTHSWSSKSIIPCRSFALPDFYHIQVHSLDPEITVFWSSKSIFSYWSFSDFLWTPPATYHNGEMGVKVSKEKSIASFCWFGFCLDTNYALNLLLWLTLWQAPCLKIQISTRKNSQRFLDSLLWKLGCGSRKLEFVNPGPNY